MKTPIVMLVLGSAVFAAALAPAYATRKSCDVGHFWSAKARACVAAGSQAKPVAMCPAHDTEGNMTELPCSDVNK